jgi:hypothetical protein
MTEDGANDDLPDRIAHEIGTYTKLGILDKARDIPSPEEYEDGLVWHYTSLSVLLTLFKLTDGVRADQDARDRGGFRFLRATSSQYLNDSEEFKVGRDTFANAIALRLESPHSDFEGQLLDDIREVCESSTGQDVYCACFSARGDDLGQWRAYGDGGRGVSIGFNCEELKTFVNGWGNWVTYDPVVYTRFANDIIDSLLSLVLVRINRRDVPWPTLRPVLSQECKRFLPACFLLLKHDGFKDEREFRVVYDDVVRREPVDPCFRSVGARTIPFVQLGFCGGRPAPFTALKLGPGCKSDANYHALSRLFDILDKRVWISHSEIPLVPM